MNLSPFVFVFLWLAAMAILVGVSWWRKWHRELAAARHTYRAAEQDVEAATAFYGSMQLDDERAWQVHHEWERREEQRETNWLTATMAELSPEALDSGPGADPPLAAAPGPAPVWADRNAGRFDSALGGPGSDHTLSSVPGPPTLAPASLAPVHERLAGIGDIHEAHQTHPHPEDGWLDAQLADLYDWVRTQLEAA